MDIGACIIGLGKYVFLILGSMVAFDLYISGTPSYFAFAVLGLVILVFIYYCYFGYQMKKSSNQ